jgi:APA family basic amino acid/polyamine antiporter
MRSPAEGPKLTAFDIGCVVVGGIIGVGIFFTPQKVALAVDGPGEVVLAWGIGGLIAILGALVFAELSARVPGHGGTFTYIREAFGRLPAFLYGWANWLVIQAGALAVIGLVMVDYADALLFGAPSTSPGTKVAIAAAAIGLFTALNALGLRVGRRVQNALTVLKTLAVFALVALALLALGRELPAAATAAEPRSPRGLLAGLAAAMLPVLFSFGGWQQGSFVAGAARRRHDVALGILGGVLVVVVAYLAVNLAFLSLLGFEGARAADAIGAAAARAALEPFGLGDVGARFLAGLVVLSSLGIMNTICLAPPFVLHAMARQGLFFAAAGRLHPTRHVPVLGVLVQGIWAILLCVGSHLAVLALQSEGSAQDALGFLLDGVVFVDWLFFGLCGVALLRLRAAGHGEADGGFRTPCCGPVSWAFTALALGVMAGAIWTSPLASGAGLSMCALGLPFFLRLRR